jgi:hypothetical protein
MTIKNIVIGATCVGAICLFSAFGGEKMTLADQMKKVDEVVSENVASFSAKKREECEAMVMQKATGLAEVEIAKIPMPKGAKKVVAPVKKAVAPVKKAPVVAPKPAPVVTPKPAPAPSTQPTQKTRTGSSNSTTPEEQKTRNGASNSTTPEGQKTRGGAVKTDGNN